MTPRYLAMLAALMPAGVFGLSVALASTAEASNRQTVPETEIPPVADRLAEIRQAVSETLAAEETQEEGERTQLAWWGNFHGGGWHGGWGNGGWHNGGWHNWGNGGWGNGGWNNWHNFWHNW